MTTDTTGSLASALAAFQAQLPTIRKGETAKVETKGGGSYSYSYADLAHTAAAVHPRLAEFGLSFIARPTLTDTGSFVLAYSLMHTSGEREDGTYPLPNNGTPQAIGSAITYARRYVLCAVTGVAPEDDDGQAAEVAAREPVQVDTGPLRELVGAAKAAGLSGDFDATLEWASQSQGNVEASCRKLRRALDDHAAAKKDPQPDVPEPEAEPEPEPESERKEEPAGACGSGEDPDAPPTHDGYDVIEHCQVLGVPWGKVVGRIIADWPENDQAAKPRPTRTALVELVEGRPELVPMVRATVDDLASEPA